MFDIKGISFGPSPALHVEQPDGDAE